MGSRFKKKEKTTIMNVGFTEQIRRDGEERERKQKSKAVVFQVMHDMYEILAICMNKKLGYGEIRLKRVEDQMYKQMVAVMGTGDKTEQQIIKEWDGREALCKDIIGETGEEVGKKVPQSIRRPYEHKMPTPAIRYRDAYLEARRRNAAYVTDGIAMAVGYTVVVLRAIEKVSKQKIKEVVKEFYFQIECLRDTYLTDLTQSDFTYMLQRDCKFKARLF